MNLVDAVRKWANLAPDRTVVVDSTTDRRITFSELLSRVIRLSNGFASLGLVKGDRVAVLSTNSIEYFEVYYACAMSGLIAQPINWRLSAEEIARIIEDGEPSCDPVANGQCDACSAVDACTSVTCDACVGCEATCNAMVVARPGVARAASVRQVAGLKLNRARRWGDRAIFNKRLLWWPRG